MCWIRDVNDIRKSRNKTASKDDIRKNGSPTHVDYDIEEVLKFVKNDKKFDGSMITIIQVDEIGKGYLKEVELDRLRKHMEENRL